MAGLALAFACGPVLPLGDHRLVSVPEVAEHAPALVGGRHPRPQQDARRFASVAHGVGNDLARPAALGQPDPPLVPAEADE